MRLRLAPWLVVTLLTACADREARLVAGLAAAVAHPSPGAARSSPPDPAAAQIADALEFLDRWTRAQRELDFAAYAALYEPHTFRGVKRTANGKVREFDHAGWTRDRARMFEQRFEIATEPRSVETWLDPASKLKRGMIVVRLVQRWRSATYADHGVKVLHLWRGPDQALRITYEDLLNSEAGWDRAVDGVATADLRPPRDQTEALALWRTLDPRGADYHEKLAAIPDDEAVRRPMARAMLATGNVVCTAVVRYSECGDDRLEWDDLPATADLDDPCLRRRLAAWALAEVTAEDLAGLDAELVHLAGLEPPEEELPEALGIAIADAPEPLRLKVVGALLAAGRESAVSVDGLSDAGLIAAARLGVDDAALALTPSSHVAVLAEVVVSPELEVATRATLVASLAGLDAPGVGPALAAVAQTDDCGLAMTAAQALADRGDPSSLPRRTAGQSEAAARHALCMLIQDGDQTRADQRLAEFIGKDGATVVETIEDPWAAAAQIDAGPDDVAEDDAGPEPALTDVADIRQRLDEVFGGQSSWDRAELALVPAADGWLIGGFDFYRYNGCGC